MEARTTCCTLAVLLLALLGVLAHTAHAADATPECTLEQAQASLVCARLTGDAKAKCEAQAKRMADALRKAVSHKAGGGKASLADYHHHSSTVNPPGSGECPRPSYTRHHRHHDSYEEAYAAAGLQGDATTEYHGHDSGLANPRPHARIPEADLSSISLLDVTYDGTSTTSTDPAEIDAYVTSNIVLAPKTPADGNWQITNFVTWYWNSGRITIETDDGLITGNPTAVTISGAWAQPIDPPASGNSLLSSLTLLGANRQVQEICFTPADITGCTVFINGNPFFGTIDTAASTDWFGPITVGEWLFRTVIDQYWPGSRHTTFRCVISP